MAEQYLEHDITKTGPVGLRGLRGINTQKTSKDILQESIAANKGAYTGNFSVDPTSPAYFTPQHMDPQDPMADWGSSQYDTIGSSMTFNPESLNESRYENQSTIAAMGNAVAKMLGTAATTIISGLANIPVGLGTAIEEGRWSGLWDNELTRTLSDVDKYMEESFKIYQSKEQQDAPWLSWTNLTSASFWGDDVIKNVGFMLGAAASGSVFTGGLGLASKALGLVNSASRASKIATGVLGSLFSAAGEGAIEARQTMESLVELNNQKLDDELARQQEAAYAKYMATGDINAYKQALNDIETRRIMGRQQILQDARSAGNLDMLLNMPILTASNFITLGKGFSKSFSNAARMAEANNRAGGLINPIRFTKEKLKDIFNKASRGETIEGVESTLKGNMKLRKAWEFSKPILSEGSEEMNQQFASSFAGYYKGNREDVNDYWKARMNPGAEQDAMSFWTALGKGFFDSWGSFDQWEQFFVGGLTGATGMLMPTKAFKRSEEDNKKKWYNPSKYFSWEGGSFQNLKDFNRRLDEATQYNEELNKRFKDPNFWNRIRSGVAHAYFQKSMDEGVADDDIKSYKDAEEKQFVQDLDAFVKAGKVDDFITLINASTQDLSDEDIADLVNRNTVHITREQDEANKKARIQERIDSLTEILNSEETSPEDRLSVAMETASLQQELSEVQGEEKYIGLYTDSNGNLTKSYDEIRQELQDNGNKLLERVKEYQNSIAYVNALSQGKLTSDQEGNLAYLDYMGKAQKKRANKLMDKYKIPDSFVIRPEKNETVEVVQKALNLPDGSVIKNGNGTFTVNISSLEGERKRDVFLSAALGHDKQSVAENATNMVNAAENKEEAFKDINDAIKLFLDSREFYNVFNEYMGDPSKVDEDKAKAEKEADKEKNDSNIDNKSVSDIVEGAENGDIDIDGSEFDFTDDDMDIISGKNPGATITPEIERKQKVNTAREIRDTKNQAKVKTRTMGLDDTTIADLDAMIDRATSGAESADDILDTDTEAFNDPESLSTTEEEQQLLEVINDPNNSLEDVEAARQLYQESRQQRLDELKNIVQEIKEGVANDLGELKNLPKSGPNAPRVVRTFDDNKSKDPTEVTPTTNKKRDSKEDIQEEETPTPNIQSLNPEEQPDSQPKQMPEKGYWKGNTTEYPIHRDKTNNRPFYEQIDDKTRQAISKAIYTFLKETGAYERIKNNEIKPGQKVRFAISKRLTNTINKATGQGTPVILVVDENGNVLCDLPCPACVTIFNKYPGLKEFYDEAVKYTNEHFNDNTDDLIIIPNFESSISRPYIGRPLYSANNVRHILNEIADGKPFKLGIALTSSPNPTMVMTPGRRKAQGPSKEDLTIVRPESGLAGQPYLLIETSDPNRKWLTVPITMPTFSATGGARLTRMIIEHLLQLSNPQDLLTEEQQIAWKNKLRDLLSIGDIYLDIKQKPDNSGYTVNLRIKRLKSDTAWTTVFNGEVGAGDLLIQRVESLNIPYQVSRKYINSQFNGQDYNSLIGELASTNLEIGALHTVNDFFTINPIINGKQQKAKPIQDAPRDAENKAKATRENTFVTGNIVPDQVNVDRSRTDGNYYYIRESDGKYHKYQRVHNILPVNSNNTVSANSQRALRTGSAVDTIIRDFFNTGKTTKPDFMSDEAYNSILKYLNTLNKWLKDHKWTVYANNIVLYNKYPDGRRIAGEVDLLLVDDEGNYHIYDVKTSAGSFTGDYFEGVHSNWGQVMSTKDYYTLQVSSYAKLLNDRFGKKTASVAIVPFNIVYGDNDNVTGITKIPNISLPIVDVSNNFKNATPETSQQSSSSEDYVEKAVIAEGELNTANAEGGFGVNSKDALFDNLSVDDGRTFFIYKKNPDGSINFAPKNRYKLFGAEAKSAVEMRGELLENATGMYVIELGKAIPKKSREGRTYYEITKPAVVVLTSPNVDLKEAQRRREEMTKSTQAPESKPDTSEPRTSVDTARENLGNNKLFKPQKWQNRLSRLNDKNILGLNEMAKRNPILKRTLDHLDAMIKANMSDEELNNLVAEQLKPKNREVERTAQEQSSIDKEVEVIEKLLPQLSQEDRVRIVDSLINIPNGRAWGQFKDGAIILYRNAARGTSYHEAFHFVFNTLMTNEELNRAFDAAEKRYGNLSPIELEERLAEEFREYMQNEETFVGRLKNLWSKLKSLLNHFNSNWNYLDRVYADISRGSYSNREVRGNQSTRNRVVPTIPFMQNIVDSQVNNSTHTRTGKNKEWGKIADIWKKDGYRLRGHYDAQSKKYIVTSVTPILTTKELRQYHANRLAYRNLDQESRDYLNERHISPQEYERMTLKEKEVLFRCMY